MRCQPVRFAQRRLTGRETNPSHATRDRAKRNRGVHPGKRRHREAVAEAVVSVKCCSVKEGADMLNVNPGIGISTVGESARKTGLPLMEGTDLWCFEMSDRDLLLRM